MGYDRRYFLKKSDALYPGPITLLLMLLHRLTLGGALDRLSRRLGLHAVPVILADGSHAIDVDNRRTCAAAAAILRQRTAGASRPA